MADNVTSTGSVAAPTSTPQHSADPPRQSRIDRLTSPGGLFLSAVMIAAAFPLTSPIRDPDFWWHLRGGQLILQNGGLLHTDPFTYTVSSHVWTMHEWLSEVLFAALYRWNGLAAVVVVLSVVSWLGVLCIFVRARFDRPGPLVLGGGMILAGAEKMPEVEVFAAADTRKSALDSFQTRYEGRVYDSVKALCEDPDVEVVWVATPNNMHSEHVVMAAEHGKPVVSESALPQGRPLTSREIDDAAIRQPC